ncbi:MAG: helix-hairpin-helix domain-containing protein [Proteobacteria bacterium]|nr:helix-hairpin-helix domain-containing protein [Pseudomonadota bacterium]
MRGQIFLFILLLSILVFYKSFNQSEKRDIQFVREKINLSTASKEELVKLKGIGEKRAERIIEQRSKGRIQKEELIKIIGKKTFDNLSSSIFY